MRRGLLGDWGLALGRRHCSRGAQKRRGNLQVGFLSTASTQVWRKIPSVTVMLCSCAEGLAGRGMWAKMNHSSPPAANVQDTGASTRPCCPHSGILDLSIGWIDECSRSWKDRMLIVNLYKDEESGWPTQRGGTENVPKTQPFCSMRIKSCSEGFWRAGAENFLNTVILYIGSREIMRDPWIGAKRPSVF